VCGACGTDPGDGATPFLSGPYRRAVAARAVEHFAAGEARVRADARGWLVRGRTGSVRACATLTEVWRAVGAPRSVPVAEAMAECPIRPERFLPVEIGRPTEAIDGPAPQLTDAKSFPVLVTLLSGLASAGRDAAFGVAIPEALVAGRRLALRIDGHRVVLASMGPPADQS
jgi:hypothetical protein